MGPETTRFLFVLLLLTGCDGGGTGQPAWSTRDSAGITIAENRNTDALQATPAVSDSVGTALELGEILYLQSMLPYGESILVGGAGSGALLRHNLATGQTESLGRSGQGPGEFGSVSALYRCGGDTLVVQSTPSRLSWLDSTGAFVRMLERPRFRYTTLAMATDCSAVAVVVPERGGTSDDPLDRQLGVSWHHLGTDSVVATAFAPYAEGVVVNVRGRALPVPLPYGNLPSIAARGDLVYVALGNLPEIRVYDRHRGLTRIIRWEATPNPVTDTDGAKYDEILAYLGETYGPEEVMDFPPARAFDLPASKPLYSRMLVAENGHLWVQRYPDVWIRFEESYGAQFGRQDTQWWVFDADGRLLGLFATPRTVYLHAIGGGRAFGVRRDSMDFEQVTVLPLVAGVGR